MVVTRRRFRRSSVPAQIGADDGVNGRNCNPVPRCVRSRVPVQEHERRTRAAVAYAQQDVTDPDPLEFEAVEKRHP